MSRAEEWDGPVRDGGEPLPADSRAVRFTGRVWAVVSEEVRFGGDRAATAWRDLVQHPGAVAVIALDAADRVLLIRQYRHPVGRYLFEPPAGLLDVEGESPWRTAERELAEESGLTASDWALLVDQYMSPGGSSEAVRVYLARGLGQVPGGRPLTGAAEEQHLPRAWVDLDEARDLVLSGAIGSPTAVSGILAAWTARAGGWLSLRPVDAPWPARDALLATDRVFRVGGH